MNTDTKVAVGVLVGAVALIGLYLTLGFTAPVVPSPTATSTPLAATTTPRANAGSSTKRPAQPVIKVSDTVIVKSKIAVDQSALYSTSTYPTLTGTANVSTVTVIVSDSNDVGLVATDNIEVVDGHWSYSVPVALSAGTYRLLVAGGNTSVNQTLTIQ